MGLQAAKERKQQAAGKKVAFARSDSLKADEAATKHKLKQAIEPAVKKTAQDRKLEEAWQRKREASEKKAAFARSDSLKSDEIYAKSRVVQECIRPAVAKASIDHKAINRPTHGPMGQPDHACMHALPDHYPTTSERETERERERERESDAVHES